jgi:hypothetical protein
MFSNSIDPQDISKEDINFPEFPLGFLARQQLTNEREISFNSFSDPELKITIQQSTRGYPTQSTRDTYRALMKLTLKKTRFTSRSINVSAREIIQEMGQTVGGSQLKQLKQNLFILAGTRIVFENSFYNKNKKRYETDTVNFGIISSFRLKEFKEDENFLRELVGESQIIWNETFWDFSMQDSKNLINYDYSYYIQLKGNLTKELYILLNKRCYNKSKMVIGLECLAYEKLGLSTTVSKAKAKQQLKKAHTELLSTGYLKEMPRFVVNSSGELDVVYEVSQDKKVVTTTSNIAVNDFKPDEMTEVSILETVEVDQTIKEKLINIGFTQGQVGKFFVKHGIEKIELYLALLELSQAKGKVRSPKAYFLCAINEGWDIGILNQGMQNDVDSSKTSDTTVNSVTINEIVRIEKPLEQDSLFMETSKVDRWIDVNPGKYFEYCRDFLRQLKSNNPFLSKQIEKLSIQDKQEEVDVLQKRPIFSQMVKQKLSEEI